MRLGGDFTSTYKAVWTPVLNAEYILAELVTAANVHMGCKIIQEEVLLTELIIAGWCFNHNDYSLYLMKGSLSESQLTSTSLAELSVTFPWRF